MHKCVGGWGWRTNVKWSLVYQWSVLAYSVCIHIYIFGRVCARVSVIEDEERWILKAQKIPLEIFFLTRNRENENEWKIEGKKKKTRKKIKSPYDAIYTARMCNVFDWRISMRAHTLVSGGELNMYWTIEHIYSPTLLFARAHTLICSFFSFLFSFFFFSFTFLTYFLLSCCCCSSFSSAVYKLCLGVKFIHANRFDSFQRAALTA